MLDYNQWISK